MLHKKLLILFFFCVCVDIYAQYTTHGDAISNSGDCYTITPDNSYSQGAIWFDSAVDLNQSFKLIYDINLGCNDNGGDGMAFVIRGNNSSVSPSLGNMGYLGISPSISLEFDTYHHIVLGDSIDDHYSLMKNGNTDHNDVMNTLIAPTLFDSSNIEDCMSHNVRIEWYSDSTKLKVFFDCKEIVNYTGNIINTVFGGNNSVYFGWTASTSLDSNHQTVCELYNSISHQISDTIICIGDSLYINAPYGDSLIWSSPTSIDTSGNQISFFPTLNTQYLLEAYDQCQFVYNDTFSLEVSDDTLLMDTSLIFCKTSNFNLNVSSGYMSYLWSNGDTLASITSNTPSIYTVIATDLKGCTYYDTINVKAMGIAALPSQAQYCLGDSINLYIENSLFPSGSLNWSTGQTDSLITIIVNGTELISVSMLGCQDSIDINMNDLGLVLSDSLRVCYGDTANVSVNNIFDTYYWSTGDTSELINVTLSDIYHLTVSDSNNCRTKDSIKVIVASALNSSISTTPETCPYSNDGIINAQFVIDFPIDSIIWSNGLNGNNVNNLDSGIYYVTIYDNAACVYIDTVIIGLESNMQVQTTGDSLSCYGDANGQINIQVSNGFGAYQYEWSNGATTAQNNNLIASNYTITVTDDAFCTITDQAIVWSPPQLIANATDSAYSCASSNSGSANVAVSGGIPPYLYQWSNSDTLSIINNLSLGTYSVIVTDSNGCQSIDSTIVTVSKPLNISLSSDTNLICFGDSINLSAMLVDSGSPGVPVAHVYQWLPINYINDTNSLNVIAKPIQSLWYRIKVTDGNLCEAYDSVYINVNPPLTVIASPDDTICVNEVIQLSANVVDSGTLGVPAPYAYQWTPIFGLNNPNIDMPLADPDTTTTYHLQIIDSNLCVADDSLTIHVSPYLNLEISEDTFICYGDSALISASIDAGAGGYNFTWSPTDFLSDSTQLSQTCSPTDTTQYILSVVDINGCHISDSILIEVNPEFIVNASAYPMASCNFEPVELSVIIDSVSQGTPTHTFLWDNIALVANDSLVHNDSSNTMAYLQDTSIFRIEVTDMSLCKVSDTVMVYINPPLNISLTADTNFICYGDSIYLQSILIDSGTAGFPISHIFQWIPTGLIADTLNFNTFAYPSTDTLISIMVTDGNLCTAVDSVLINVNPPLIVDAGIGDTICNGQNITLTSHIIAQGTPGSPAPHAYSWNPVNFTSSPNLFYTDVFPDSTTVFTVNILDMMQCIASDTVRVEVIDLQASLGNDTLLCEGSSLNLSGQVNGLASWTDNNAGGQFNDSSILFPTYYLGNINLSDVTISLIIQDSLGLCGAKFDTLKIYVDTMPQLSIMNTEVSICSGDFINLNSVTSNVDSLIWAQIYSGGYFTTAIDQNNTQYTSESLVSNSQQCFILEGFKFNACPSKKDTYCLNILQSPYGSIDSVYRFCLGDTGIIDLNFLGVSNILWSDSNMGGSFNSSSLLSQIEYTNDSLEKSLWIYYTLESNVGCLNKSDSFMIIIDTIPEVDILNLDSAYCYNDSVNLLGKGAAFYSWYEIQNNILDTLSDSTDNIVVYFTDTTHIKIEAYDSNYCFNESYELIDLKIVPDIEALITFDSASCYPLPVDFSYNISLPPSMSVLTNVWDIGDDINYSEAEFTHIYQKEIGASYPKEYIISLDVLYDNFCTSSDSLSLMVCEGVMIPNIITPNGDGQNEVFRIPGYFEKMAPCSISLYDRWGNLVYENSNYQNDWNGVTSEGKATNGDTFFYNLRCDNKEWSGWIRVLY